MSYDHIKSFNRRLARAQCPVEPDEVITKRNRRQLESAAHRQRKIFNQLDRTMGRLLTQPMSQGRNAPPVDCNISLKTTIERMYAPSTYLAPDHPVRVTAQQRACEYVPGILDDFVWSHDKASVVLPPLPKKALERVKEPESKALVRMAPDYAPPELWLPTEWFEEPETECEAEYKPQPSTCLLDPLVQLLIAEGSLDEVHELNALHRAGSTQIVNKHFMEQRPDLYPQVKASTAQVVQFNQPIAQCRAA